MQSWLKIYNLISHWCISHLSLCSVFTISVPGHKPASDFLFILCRWSYHRCDTCLHQQTASANGNLTLTLYCLWNILHWPVKNCIRCRPGSDVDLVSFRPGSAVPADTVQIQGWGFDSCQASPPAAVLQLNVSSSLQQNISALINY